jgi:hypothetical protein
MGRHSSLAFVDGTGHQQAGRGAGASAAAARVPALSRRRWAPDLVRLTAPVVLAAPRISSVQDQGGASSCVVFGGSPCWKVLCVTCCDRHSAIRRAACRGRAAFPTANMELCLSEPRCAAECVLADVAGGWRLAAGGPWRRAAMQPWPSASLCTPLAAHCHQCRCATTSC